MEQEQIQLSK